MKETVPSRRNGGYGPSGVKTSKCLSLRETADPTKHAL